MYAFGSARFASDREPHVPGRAPPSIYGTPGYAPPEQYRGLTEPRSDVYALAATLLVTATYRGAAGTVSLWRIAGGTFQLVCCPSAKRGRRRRSTQAVAA